MLKIKNIVFSVTLVLLVINFTGCSQKVPDVIKEYQYIEQECPKPLPKPKFMEYQAVIMEFTVNGNNEIYYAIPKSQIGLLNANWISYRKWAEGNYSLMNSRDLNNVGNK